MHAYSLQEIWSTLCMAIQERECLISAMHGFQPQCFDLHCPLNFVKRKASTSQKVPPADLESIMEHFPARVSAAVKAGSIPSHLVLIGTRLPYHCFQQGNGPWRRKDLDVFQLHV